MSENEIISQPVEHTKEYEKKQEAIKNAKNEIRQKKYVDTYKKNYQKYKVQRKKDRIAKIKKWTCTICNRIMNDERKDAHLTTKLHLSSVKIDNLVNKKKKESLDPVLTETSDTVKK